MNGLGRNLFRFGRNRRNQRSNGRNDAKQGFIIQDEEDTSIQKFGSDDFSVTKYVDEYYKENSPATAQQHINELQKTLNKTNNVLKAYVRANHLHFVRISNRTQLVESDLSTMGVLINSLRTTLRELSQTNDNNNHNDSTITHPSLSFNINQNNNNTTSLIDASYMISSSSSSFPFITRPLHRPPFETNDYITLEIYHSKGSLPNYACIHLPSLVDTFFSLLLDGRFGDVATLIELSVLVGILPPMQPLLASQIVDSSRSSISQAQASWSNDVRAGRLSSVSENYPSARVSPNVSNPKQGSGGNTTSTLTISSLDESLDRSLLARARHPSTAEAVAIHAPILPTINPQPALPLYDPSLIPSQSQQQQTTTSLPLRSIASRSTTKQRQAQIQQQQQQQSPPQQQSPERQPRSGSGRRRTSVVAPPSSSLSSSPGQPGLQSAFRPSYTDGVVAFQPSLRPLSSPTSSSSLQGASTDSLSSTLGFGTNKPPTSWRQLKGTSSSIYGSGSNNNSNKSNDGSAPRLVIQSWSNTLPSTSHLPHHYSFRTVLSGHMLRLSDLFVSVLLTELNEQSATTWEHTRCLNTLRRLNQAPRALHRMLGHKSDLMARSRLQTQFKGSPIMVAQYACSSISAILSATIKEFITYFDTQRDVLVPILASWILSEIRLLGSHLCSQLLSTTDGISAISSCLHIVSTMCDDIQTKHGVSIKHAMAQILRTPIVSFLDNQVVQLQDIIADALQHDTWQPLTMLCHIPPVTPQTPQSVLAPEAVLLSQRSTVLSRNIDLNSSFIRDYARQILDDNDLELDYEQHITLPKHVLLSSSSSSSPQSITLNELSVIIKSSIPLKVSPYIATLYRNITLWLHSTLSIIRTPLWYGSILNMEHILVNSIDTILTRACGLLHSRLRRGISMYSWPLYVFRILQNKQQQNTSSSKNTNNNNKQSQQFQSTSNLFSTLSKKGSSNNSSILPPPPQQQQTQQSTPILSLLSSSSSPQQIQSSQSSQQPPGTLTPSESSESIDESLFILSTNDILVILNNMHYITHYMTPFIGIYTAINIGQPVSALTRLTSKLQILTKKATNEFITRRVTFWVRGRAWMYENKPVKLPPVLTSVIKDSPLIPIQSSSLTRTVPLTSSSLLNLNLPPQSSSSSSTTTTNPTATSSSSSSSSTTTDSTTYVPYLDDESKQYIPENGYLFWTDPSRLQARYSILPALPEEPSLNSISNQFLLLAKELYSFSRKVFALSPSPQHAESLLQRITLEILTQLREPDAWMYIRPTRIQATRMIADIRILVFVSFALYGIDQDTKDMLDILCKRITRFYASECLSETFFSHQNYIKQNAENKKMDMHEALSILHDIDPDDGHDNPDKDATTTTASSSSSSGPTLSGPGYVLQSPPNAMQMLESERQEWMSHQLTTNQALLQHKRSEIELSNTYYKNVAHILLDSFTSGR